MNLYDIDAGIKAAIEEMFDTVNEETGEIEPGTIERIEELQIERAAKLENIGAYMKNEAAEIEAIKAEAAKLNERAKVKTNHLERLKSYVADSMQKNDEPKFESARVVFSFRKSEPVNIFDEEIIPAEFMKIKTTAEPDKAAIKKAIKAGAIVPGAILEEKQNLQIK